MTKANLRKQVLNYFEHADDKKIEAAYTLIVQQDEKAFRLTDDELQELLVLEKLHAEGKSKSYTKEEVFAFAKSYRKT